MMQPLNEFLNRNNVGDIHTYGLLALDADADPFNDDRFKDLLHTPTLTTSSDTLRTFGAVSFPFVVITDGAGRIRFLGTVAQSAFDTGGFVEQVIDKNNVGRSAPKSAADATPSANH
jgi:hypothetical protein